MRTPSAICAVLLLAGTLPRAATAADELPRVRMISVDDAAVEQPLTPDADSPQPAAVGHCSIVGAVQSPGTYTGSGAGVLLQTLIEQAGGLTGRASGIVRILHNGQQEVINLAVSAGADVVPWESVIVADPAATTSQTQSDGAPPFCDIACVNLCNRPAVFCLNPQHATLPQLLNLLGQSPETAATVRVVLPAGAAHTHDHALPSGSVVLFNPAALDQPALAAVLQRSPLQDLVAIPPVDHQQVSAEVVEHLQTLENYLQSAAGTSVAEPAHAAPAPTEPLPAPTATPSTAPLTLSAPDPVVEFVPENTLVQPASAFQLQPVAGRHPIVEEEDFTSADYERAKQKTLAAKARAQSDAASDEVVASTSVDANPQWLRFGTSVVAWLLCGLAAYGAFGVWMRQHEKRRHAALRSDTPIELPKPAAQVESRSVLSQLIENSLPIREEEVTSPCQVFHGRTVGFRYLIRSGPHGLQGPHFAAQRAQQRPAPAAVAAGVRSRPGQTETKSTARERTINRFDRANEGIPARDSDRPATSPPTATRGVSPLERALRSLMRESAEGRT